MKKSVHHIIILIVLFIIAFALGVVVTVKCIETRQSTEKESEAEEESQASMVSESEENEVGVCEEEIDIFAGTVSIFSWYFELTNQPLFYHTTEPLKQMGVTRVYQLMSAESVVEPETLIMISNLQEIGIETILLTGSATWIKDGAAEYEQIIDSIVRYNQSTLPELQINAVAIDVEAHILPEWENDSQGVFAEYVELMKHLKDYANANGVKVIQVIPTTYDDVDKDLFDVFLRECCDEISIMNYNRKTAHKDIKYEVQKATEYGIPVETIFETMPLSEEHLVTSDMTYYYEGTEALQRDALQLKEVYGKELGIAYHHYMTLYEMCTGETFGEITLFTKHIVEGTNPGNVVLKGNDGSILLATPYCTPNQKNEKTLSWLVPGAKENVIYTATYYEVYSGAGYVEEIVFIPGDNGKLQAVLWETDGE